MAYFFFNFSLFLILFLFIYYLNRVHARVNICLLEYLIDLHIDSTFCLYLIFIYLFNTAWSCRSIVNTEGHDLITELNTVSIKPSGTSVRFYCKAHNLFFFHPPPQKTTHGSLGGILIMVALHVDKSFYVNKKENQAFVNILQREKKQLTVRVMNINDLYRFHFPLKGACGINMHEVGGATGANLCIFMSTVWLQGIQAAQVYGLKIHSESYACESEHWLCSEQKTGRAREMETMNVTERLLDVLCSKVCVCRLTGFNIGVSVGSIKDGQLHQLHLLQVVFSFRL